MPRVPLMPHAVAALCLALATGAFAQQSPPGQETFSESVDVRVVNLEVVVTDRDGERVPGLLPEDFILYVDGQEMPVDYFTEILEGTAVARSAGYGPGGVPATTAGLPVPNRLLLFLDGAFGFPAAFERFKGAFEEQLGALGPDDEMAIIAYDGSRLAELCGWTSSREELLAALDEVDPSTFDGPSRFAEWKSYQAAIRDEQAYVAESGPGGSGRLSEAIVPVKPLADLPEYGVLRKRLERRVDRVSRAVEASLHRFSETGGRKLALVWSGGWPWSSAQFLKPPWSTDQTKFGTKTEDSLRRVADTANRLGFTLYMLDTPINFYDEEGQRQHHTSLDMLAEETGGRSFKNFSSLEAIAGSLEDVRSYYWLGFTADGDGSGEHFELEVELTRPGLEVRTRETWLDLPEEQAIDQRVLAEALFAGQEIDAAGDGGGAGEGLELDFGEPVIDGRRAEVPVVVGIPLGAITMLPGPDGYAADLEVRVSVVDSDGATNEMPIIPLAFSGAEPPREGDVFYYETRLEMRAKPHDVTIAVRDKTSGAVLTGHHSIDL